MKDKRAKKGGYLLRGPSGTLKRPNFMFKADKSCLGCSVQCKDFSLTPQTPTQADGGIKYWLLARFYAVLQNQTQGFVCVWQSLHSVNSNCRLKLPLPEGCFFNLENRIEIRIHTGAWLGSPITKQLVKLILK